MTDHFVHFYSKAPLLLPRKRDTHLSSLRYLTVSHFCSSRCSRTSDLIFTPNKNCTKRTLFNHKCNIEGVIMIKLLSFTLLVCLTCWNFPSIDCIVSHPSPYHVFWIALLLSDVFLFLSSLSIPSLPLKISKRILNHRKLFAIPD